MLVILSELHQLAQGLPGFVHPLLRHLRIAIVDGGEGDRQKGVFQTHLEEPDSPRELGPGAGARLVQRLLQNGDGRIEDLRREGMVGLKRYFAYRRTSRSWMKFKVFSTA